MYHVLVEMYNYTDSWRNLSEEHRNTFIGQVMAGVAGLADAGVEVIAYGANAPSTPLRAPYDFFCVYRAKDQASMTSLQDAIAESGWYTYFDQVNVSGVALQPLAVLPANAAIQGPWENPEAIVETIPAPKRRLAALGHTMAYYEMGSGSPIVFLHGDAMSSYLWRQIVPHTAELGRSIALDLIGAGDSDKLADAGPDSYRFAEHARYLEAALEALDLGDDVVLVGHDWGANLAFDWAMNHADRIKGIAFSEAVLPPFEWDDWPAPLHGLFQLMRSPEGEIETLQNNIFVLGATQNVTRVLSEQEIAEIVRPYADPGEGRRPTVTWPREVPLGEEPTPTHKAIGLHTEWLRTSALPKLHLQGVPGGLDFGRRVETIRSFPNLTQRKVSGWHFTPEDDPHAMGRAIVEWVRNL
jgi:haloalkane dehalogenase